MAKTTVASWTCSPRRPGAARSPSGSPRYFGFVIGGITQWRSPPTGWCRPGTRTPASTSTSPLSAAIEDIAAGWLLDLFDLPRGFPGGASSPAARWRISPAWRPRGMACCAAPAGMSKRMACTAHLASTWSSRPRRTSRSTLRSATSAWARGRSCDVRHRRAGTHARGPPARGAGRRGRADDRLRAGGQREHRCVRSAAGDRELAHARNAWLHSTARSVCGRVRVAPTAPWPTESSWPIRGRPTRTSGSTCRTTPASRSCATPGTIVRR